MQIQLYVAPARGYATGDRFDQVCHPEKSVFKLDSDFIKYLPGRNSFCRCYLRAQLAQQVR